MFPLDCARPGMAQAVLVDEVLPKGMVVGDQAIAQWVGTEGRPDTVMGMVVHVIPQLMVSGPRRPSLGGRQTLISQTEGAEPRSG